MTPTLSAPITSAHNPRVQFIRSLLEDRSARKQSGLFVMEGVRLAEEVSIAGIKPHSLYFSEKLSPRGRQLLERFRPLEIPTYEVDAELLIRLSDTETSQGILLVLPIPSADPPPNVDLALIIDQLRDPGNMGTILRSAAAIGVPVVFIPPGSVDPYSPKVVRAGMGAHLHLCLSQWEWAQVTAYCHAVQPKPLQCLLADATGGQSMWQTDLKQPLVLIVGGEAEGASEYARSHADAILQIPMPGHTESLNAGVAASLLLYEVIRQRQSCASVP